jgi:SH3-like domain-containing protein
MHKSRKAVTGTVTQGRHPVRQKMKRIAGVLALLAALCGGAVAAQETDAPLKTDKPPEKQCQPDIGCVTNLPLPRFVSLKGSEGNARRGPGLTHRIDWVFTRAGMPLRITAEYENWRRVEDSEGAGGWVHYSLLSGVRSVLVTLDMAELRDTPSDSSSVLAQAELGVVGRVLECTTDWCRVSLDGTRGWVEKSSLWGVKADEIVE